MYIIRPGVGGVSSSVAFVQGITRQKICAGQKETVSANDNDSRIPDGVGGPHDYSLQQLTAFASYQAQYSRANPFLILHGKYGQTKQHRLKARAGLNCHGSSVCWTDSNSQSVASGDDPIGAFSPPLQPSQSKIQISRTIVNISRQLKTELLV